MPITTKTKKKQTQTQRELVALGKDVVKGAAAVGGGALVGGAAIKATPYVVRGVARGTTMALKGAYNVGSTGFGVTKIPSVVKGGVNVIKNIPANTKKINTKIKNIKAPKLNIDIKLGKGMDLGTITGNKYGQPDFKVPKKNPPLKVHTKPAPVKIVTETVEDTKHFIDGKPKRTVKPKIIDGQKVYEGGGSKFTTNKNIDLYKPSPDSKVSRKQRGLIKKAERKISSIQASSMSDSIKSQRSNKVFTDTSKKYNEINRKAAIKSGTRETVKEAARGAKKKAAQKLIAKTIVKGAARAVPGVGAVILAKDIYDVGKFALSKRKKK